MVHVEVHIPTTELQTVELLFVVDTDRVKPKFYQIGSNGERKEVTAKADIEALKIQETEALRQLSLWKSSTPSNSQSPKTTVPSYGQFLPEVWRTRQAGGFGCHL